VDNFFRRHLTHLCATCATAYTDPLPSSQSFADYHRLFYRKEYKRKPDAPFRLRRVQSVHQKRFQELSQRLRLPATGTFLDVGCGYGYLPEAFARRGWVAHGFDPDPYAIATAQHRTANLSPLLHLRTGTVHTLEHPSDSCDLVTVFHVFEHLPDPLAALRTCFRWLVPGGYLVVEVPNLITLSHSFHSRFHPAHVVHFHAATLCRTLQQLGFVDICNWFPETHPAIRVHAVKPKHTPHIARPFLEALEESRFMEFENHTAEVSKVLRQLAFIRATRRFTSRTPRQWLQAVFRAINRISMKQA
jgi:2-polyprenyl-3-methyl-5-hydroxy-6-metoxy-1,4-benzoquinol methylase